MHVAVKVKSKPPSVQSKAPLGVCIPYLKSGDGWSIKWFK